MSGGTYLAMLAVMSLNENRFTSVRVTSLAQSIREKLNQSISAITAVNGDLRLLAFNAKIQAAKAGDAGAGFGVVASEIKELVAKTQNITNDLHTRVGHTIEELTLLNEVLETQVRGRRLAQVAGTCMDLVDRNLYERSCDVRWWATESAVVRALESTCPQSLQEASERLGTILESYTVYYDLVICDLEGRVICNGRPGSYAVSGCSVQNADWYAQARRSRSGSQFGFEGPVRSELANGEPVLVYSCGVRAGGKATGELLGVLGVVFNWNGLAREVVVRAETMLDAECAHNVRAYICSPEGIVLSASDSTAVSKAVPIPDMRKLYSSPENYSLQIQQGVYHKLLGHASSQGYETYKTGWKAIVVEDRG